MLRRNGELHGRALGSRLNHARPLVPMVIEFSIIMRIQIDEARIRCNEPGPADACAPASAAGTAQREREREREGGGGGGSKPGGEARTRLS